jgi:hypothetical protein
MYGFIYFKPLEFSDFSKLNNKTAFKLVKKSLNPADYTFVFVGSLDINTFKEYRRGIFSFYPCG